VTRALVTLPEAVGWALVLVLVVGAVLALAAFVLWLIRYAKACAADRRREKEYADEITRRWQSRQDLGRYEHDVPGRPE
jgi:hypothetical protein